MRLLREDFMKEYNRNVNDGIVTNSDISDVQPPHVYISIKQDREDAFFCKVENRYIG